MRHRGRFSGDEDPGLAGGVQSAPTNGAAPAPGAAPTDDHLTLVDHNPDAVCVHQDGYVVFVNATAMRWLGASSRHELIGHALSRFLHAESMPPVMGRVAALRRSGDATTAEKAAIVRLDGSSLYVEAISVLTTWHGRPAYQLILRDLTEHRAAREALAHQAALVDHAGDAVIAVTGSGIVTSWNPAAERIYRRPARHALAMPVETAVGATVDFEAIADAGGVVHSIHRAMDGSARTMRVSASDFDGGHVLLCSDETALRRAARNLRTVVNTLQEGVVVVDENGYVLTINPSARRILGLRSGRLQLDHGEQLRGLPVFDADGVLLSEEDRPIPRTFATGTPTIGRIVGVDRPDGRRVWLSASCQLLHAEDQEHSPVLVSFTDVTSQRAATDHLAHQAAHDALTGLPNRAHILEAVNVIHRERGALTAVLFIDLDDLKTVNDTLGHDGGDVVIQATAQRLRNAVRGHDIVGRFAGDEFVALLTGNLENGALERFVGRIRGVLAEPIDVPGGRLQLSASVGYIRTHRDDPRDAATLLRDADTAMYAAKASGRRASLFLPQP